MDTNVVQVERFLTPKGDEPELSLRFYKGILSLYRGEEMLSSVRIFPSLIVDKEVN